MTFDVILLSHAKTTQHKQITEKCIKSLVEAKNKINVNIIVLEDFDPTIKYKNTTTIFFKETKFNYNRSMNEGFKHTKSDYVFFCNNDLVFHDWWADACYQAFAMGYESLSPYCPASHKRYHKSGNHLLEGYRVGFHVSGWCIGVSRKMFERIGGFNEAVRFWYSDNLYAEQLKVENIRHVLVCNALVKHLDMGSKTLQTMGRKEMAQLTSIQRSKYEKEKRRLWDNAKKEKVVRGRT